MTVVKVRISVVTPNFNMAPYLGETISSVLRNLSPGDEYIVVDGGSTDGSVEVIRRHEKDLTHWISERDDGYAHAIAKGFRRASGDLLCWINAGDLLLDGALAKVRELFGAGDIDMVFGDDFYIDEKSRVVRLSRGFVKNLPAAMLHGGWTPLQDACFWTRDIYQRVGGIDPNLCLAADYDLFLRIAREGRTRHVPFVFSAFRRHPGQKSSDASGYAKEREQVRRRELTGAGEGALAAFVKRQFHLNAGRMRAWIAPRVRPRRDLEGRPVAELHCARYWPPADGEAS
ncbi:MAG TPA: glycosyltransferase family 2 protein [Pseudolabrys sp.]|nr:glycosyltransferase family 2 protein [Pseudolabrys sp.]